MIRIIGKSKGIRCTYSGCYDYVATRQKRGHRDEAALKRNQRDRENVDERGVMKLSEKMSAQELLQLQSYLESDEGNTKDSREDEDVIMPLQEVYQLSAKSMFDKGYQLLNPRRTDLTSSKIKDFQKSLNLSQSQHLNPILHSQQSYSQKLSAFHLGDLQPLTKSFLRQKAIIPNRSILKKIITKEYITLLKQLLEDNIFEDNDFIDDEIIEMVLDCVKKDGRNLFMANLLGFQKGLGQGRRGAQGVYQEVVLADRQEAIGRIMVQMQGSREVHKLRLLWACQKYYLYQYDLYDYILPELQKLHFDSPQHLQPKLQAETTLLLTGTFTATSMQTFYNQTIQITHNFKEWLTVYSISLILLSKLKSLPGIIDEDKANELNEVFQMVQFNLDGGVGEVLLENVVFGLLSQKENNWVYRVNYQRCRQYWFKNVSKAGKSHSQCVFNQLLGGSGSSVQVSYAQVADAKPYARSRLILTKDKVRGDKKTADSQTEMISNLLRGNYQSVFDYFMVRYTLTGNYDIAIKFMRQLKQIDRDLSFNNKDEEALYKLKVVTKFFFTESITPVLSVEDLQFGKTNTEVSQLLEGLVEKSEEEIEEQNESNTNMKQKQKKQKKRQQPEITTFFSKNKQGKKKTIQRTEELSKQKVQQLVSEVFDVEEGTQNYEAYKEILQDLQKYGLIEDKLEMKKIKQMPLSEARKTISAIADKYVEILDEEVRSMDLSIRKQGLIDTETGNGKNKVRKGRKDQDGVMGEQGEGLYEIYSLLEKVDFDEEGEQGDRQKGERLSQKEANEKRAFLEELGLSKLQMQVAQRKPDPLKQIFDEEQESRIVDMSRFARSTDHALDMDYIDKAGQRSYSFASAKDKQSKPGFYTQLKDQGNAVRDLLEYNSLIPIDDIQSIEDMLKLMEQIELNRPAKQIAQHIEQQTKHLKKQQRLNKSGRVRFSFSTMQQKPEIEAETSVEKSLFDCDKIELYRESVVQKDLLGQMMEEKSIPGIGQGLNLAKYLFLNGKREGRMLLDTKKQMTIQFTSVIGSRIKSYQSYITKTLYPYELQPTLYESLLQDQIQAFNRYQFKQIIAHMIYFSSQWTDRQVELFCETCRRQRIGYTFEQIVQFLRVNKIRVTDSGLENITNVWYQFAVVNEDMLPFVREYCKQMGVRFCTRFYKNYCATLVKEQKFDKLEALCQSVLAEIKPKPFRLGSNVTASQAARIQKEWKQKQQANYQELYLEIMEVIVENMGRKVPQFLMQFYIDYLKMRPEPNAKELAYGFVCVATIKTRFESLLSHLQKSQIESDYFMFDCLMKALLSNTRQLQQYLQRIYDVSVFNNRLFLTEDRIKLTLYLFKNTNSINSFAKFLQHCLRFQPQIDQNVEAKKQMYWILNNKVDDTSNKGILSLLDFIFSVSRAEERTLYRKVRDQEEEKERELAKIQEHVGGKATRLDLETSTDQAQLVEDSKVSSATQGTNKDASIEETKQKLSKREVKRERKDASKKKKDLANMAVDLVSEMDAPLVDDSGKQLEHLNEDKQIVKLIKSGSNKSILRRRKGLQNFGELYRAAIEVEKMQDQSDPEKGKKGKKGKK